MVKDEIELIDAMLQKGMKVREIADVLGYHNETIRREKKLLEIDKSISRTVKEIWVARIQAGRYTVDSTSMILGVPTVLIRRWIKEIGK